MARNQSINPDTVSARLLLASGNQKRCYAGSQRPEKTWKITFQSSISKRGQISKNLLENRAVRFQSFQLLQDSLAGQCIIQHRD